MNLKKLESYLHVNLLEPGPRVTKNNLLGRGLTKVEKHWYRALPLQYSLSVKLLNGS